MVAFNTQRFIDHAKATPGFSADDLADPALLRCKQTTLQGMKIDRTERLVSGVVCTDSTDMDNEIVLPGGFDMSYFPAQVKAVYLNHDYKQLPVATCRKLMLDASGTRLYCQTFVRRGAVGDDLLMAIEDGAVNGFSVGFKALEYGPPNQTEKAYHGADCVVRKAKLLEYSIVSMPANPTALIQLATKGLIRRESAVLFGLDDTAERKIYPTNGAAIRARRIVVWEE